MPGKMHRKHFPKVGEGVIYLPGGVPYEADAIPLYAPGAYTRIGNKEYIYAIAGNTLNTDLGAKNGNAQKVGFSAVAAAALAGATQIKLTCAVSLDKDQLVGGEVVIFPTDMTNSFTRGIIGSSKVVATATLTLDLDSPIPVDVPSGNGECMLNPYKGVMNENNGWHPVMGIPTVVADAGEGLWLQVGGPCWIAPDSSVGGTVSYGRVTFTGRGSIKDEESYFQIAGQVICPGTDGTSAGASFIFLQIAH